MVLIEKQKVYRFDEGIDFEKLSKFLDLKPYLADKSYLLNSSLDAFVRHNERMTHQFETHMNQETEVRFEKPSILDEFCFFFEAFIPDSLGALFDRIFAYPSSVVFYYVGLDAMTKRGKVCLIVLYGVIPFLMLIVAAILECFSDLTDPAPPLVPISDQKTAQNN